MQFETIEELVDVLHHSPLTRLEVEGGDWSLALEKPHAAPKPAPLPRAHDEHSYAEPDKVVVKDLGLDLRVDFAKKELRGAADLRLEWKDAAHRRLVLDTRDLVIDRVAAEVDRATGRCVA